MPLIRALFGGGDGLLPLTESTSTAAGAATRLSAICGVPKAALLGLVCEYVCCCG